MLLSTQHSFLIELISYWTHFLFSSALTSAPTPKNALALTLHSPSTLWKCKVCATLVKTIVFLHSAWTCPLCAEQQKLVKTMAWQYIQASAKGKQYKKTAVLTHSAQSWPSGAHFKKHTTNDLSVIINLMCDHCEETCWRQTCWLSTWILLSTVSVDALRDRNMLCRDQPRNLLVESKHKSLQPRRSKSSI